MGLGHDKSDSISGHKSGAACVLAYSLTTRPHFLLSSFMNREVQHYADLNLWNAYE